MSSPGSWDAAWRAGIHAARQNIAAGAAVWAFGGAVVVTYYTWPPAHAAWDHLAVWREHLGFLYSIVATCLFGGVLPMLFQTLVPAARGRMTTGAWVFGAAFWAYRGFEVDLFYHFQAWLFGAGTDAASVARKVCFDALIYSPIWAVPVTAYTYIWKESGFQIERMRGMWGWHGYRVYVLPALVSNWIVWIPAVSLIYSLPSPLQVPLFNLVLFLFVLILTVLTRRKE